MIKRKINTLKEIYECIIEKCMEWAYFLYNSLRSQKRWTCNLSEHYYIYKEYIGKEYVKEFLDEREKISMRNRYKIKIEILSEKADADTVGKVILYRKKRAIQQATLKVRNNRNDGIIYWSFEKDN
jgi:hypothetical protein